MEEIPGGFTPPEAAQAPAPPPIVEAPPPGQQEPTVPPVESHGSGSQPAENQLEQAAPASEPQVETTTADPSLPGSEPGTGDAQAAYTPPRPNADSPSATGPQPASADNPAGQSAAAVPALPNSEQRANVAPNEEIEISDEQLKDYNEMVRIIAEQNNIINIDDPDELIKELDGRKNLSDTLKKALKIRADIAKTHRAIATKTSQQGPAVPGGVPQASETPRQIEASYQKDKGLFRVNEKGEPIISEVIYLNQTLNVFVQELGRIGATNPRAKELGEKLASQLTRSINRPDIYVFDTSPNKEIKRRNDLNYSVSDAIVLSLEDQLNGETDINKIAQAIKDGTIKADPSVGLLANLLVWHDQAEADPQKRKLISGLMYDVLNRLDRRKLTKLGKKGPQYKEAVDKILQYRSETPQDPELAETQKTFNGYLNEFKDKIDHQVRPIYGKELADNLKVNLDSNIGHTIPMFLCAHVIENSDFMTRDETGHIVLKHEYNTQLTELTQVLGFSPAEKQMIVELALRPSGSVAIMKEVLGIDGRLLDSENAMEKQAHKASEIIVGRLQTDPEPIIPGVEANQNIGEALKSGMGKAIADMIRLNMGPSMHIDEEKLRKLLGKSFGTGAMAILMLWSQIMNVVSTTEDTLAPQGGGQQRHQ